MIKKWLCGLPAGVGIGMCFGAAIGQATHNIALWLPVGIGAGICIGIALSPLFAEDSDGDGKDKKDSGRKDKKEN